jgi:hypothetical protein
MEGDTVLYIEPKGAVLPDGVITVDDYVACVYESDGLWYLSKITNIDEVNKELNVAFFSPDGHKGFAKGYRITKESSWIATKNMLCKEISHELLLFVVDFLNLMKLNLI